MKNLYACESAINKSNPFVDFDVNLCRTYPKQIVFPDDDK